MGEADRRDNVSTPETVAATPEHVSLPPVGVVLRASTLIA
jgi:hypothetical protein